MPNSNRFLCHLTRLYIGITFVGGGRAASGSVSRFPCPERKFVTIGPNDF